MFLSISRRFDLNFSTVFAAATAVAATAASASASAASTRATAETAAGVLLSGKKRGEGGCRGTGDGADAVICALCAVSFRSWEGDV